MDDDTLTARICLALAVLPGWEYHEDDTPFSPGGTAIFFGAIESKPDRAVGVKVYGGADDRVTGIATRRVQLRFRGAPRQRGGAERQAALAFTVLQGRMRRDGINDIERISFSPPTTDDSGRDERTDNYLITLDNLEAHT